MGLFLCWAWAGSCPCGRMTRRLDRFAQKKQEKALARSINAPRAKRLLQRPWKHTLGPGGMLHLDTIEVLFCVFKEKKQQNLHKFRAVKHRHSSSAATPCAPHCCPPVPTTAGWRAPMGKSHSDFSLHYFTQQLLRKIRVWLSCRVASRFELCCVNIWKD